MSFIDAAEHAATAGLPDLVRAAQRGDSMAMAEHPLLHLVGPAAVRLGRLETDVQQHLRQQ